MITIFRIVETDGSVLDKVHRVESEPFYLANLLPIVQIGTHGLHGLSHGVCSP